MSVPAETNSAFPSLASAAAMPPGEDRDRAARNAVFHEVFAADGDEVTRQRVRAEVKRLGLMPLGLFDAIARQARDRAADFGEDRQGDGGGATARRSPVMPAPEGIRKVPGSPGWAYRRATDDRPGAVYELRGKPQAWHEVLGWAPAVSGFLETPSESGSGAVAYYYVIAAAGRRVIADGGELAAGEPWKLLPVPGTGAKRVREVLANVVLAEAAELPIGRALTRTGWHRGEDGDRYYVFADGRTSDGREVVLTGREHYGRLAAAAAPAPEAETAAVASALLAVAEHGRGAALAGLGVGVRSLAQSLHRVPGGYIAVGAPNAGKSSLGWHARCVAVAREDRADAWPPLASATFADTRTSIEMALDYEADMPSLIDDAALTASSSRAEVAEVTARLEMIFRALANDTRVRGRMDRTMLPRPSAYVRSPVIATIQGSIADVPVQNSLLRRVALLPVARGEIDLAWYRAPGNSAGLVGPLRALGEHLVIAYLAALGDAAPGYVAAKDAEAREMLAGALTAIAPGWEDHAEGLAGVADIMACALGGLLIAAEVCNLSPSVLTLGALPYLASAVAEQGRRMGDSAEVATPAEALGEIIRAALLNQRAHVRDDQGDAVPAIDGLTEQEQGLEPAGDHHGVMKWRGRGVPLYWLADDGALGVRAEGLHKLIRDSGDTRLPSKPARTLPAYLVGEGLALPSDQKTGGPTHQKRIGGAGGENLRLVYLRPDMLSPSTEKAHLANATNATNATPQVDAHVSNGESATPPERNATSQVTGASGTVGKPSHTGSQRSENTTDGACSACSVPGGIEPLPLPLPAPLALCEACGTLMSEWLRASGARYHVGCGPESAAAEFAARLGHAAPATATEAARNLGMTPRPAAAPAPRAAPVAEAARAPRRRWVVLGGDGRAYAAGGEVIELPDGALARCSNAGELAALALSLGAERCYVDGAAREVLGLPAELGAEGRPGEGVPHVWTEATDPAAWDIWPAQPVGLASWMNIYRRPSSLHEGVAVAFAEWITRAPELAELAAPELARALELIHLATTHHGEGGGGVEFHRSPAATFGRLVDKAARYSRNGRREAVEMPPPYDRKARRPKGAPAALKVPGPHTAPAEVPEGWVIARLDVRSCFASAVSGTAFGIGEAVHARGGELGKAPGAYLVRVPVLAAAHPSLYPFGPVAAGKAREGLAWLDTLAARWLAECGVPVTVIESWTWPESHRVFDSASQRLGDARARLEGAGDAASLAAASVVKGMANAFLGGRLTSDYGGERRADDWQWRPDWWYTVRAQAEVRKQRNLLPAIASDTVTVLGELAVDSVYVAAESLAAVEQMPGTGGRLAVADGRGKFKIESHATVSRGLSAVLGRRGDGRGRLTAIAEALGEEK